MSLIVAMKKDGVVYMGADTRTTRGERINSSLEEKNLKIQRVGSCYIGGAGTVACIQLLTDQAEWFQLNGKALTKKYLVQEVIPRFFLLLKKTGKMKVDENKKNPPNSGCYFLVTDGNALFMIDSDFSVTELSVYGEVGCTEILARTLFLNAPEDASPRELILEALRMSVYRNDGVGAPFVIVNTKENSYEFVEG